MYVPLVAKGSREGVYQREMCYVERFRSSRSAAHEVEQEEEDKGRVHTRVSPQGNDIRRNVTCGHVNRTRSRSHIEQFRNHLLTLSIAIVRGPIRRTAFKWDS